MGVFTIERAIIIVVSFALGLVCGAILLISALAFV
jgi:hypothetical protein